MEFVVDNGSNEHRMYDGKKWYRWFLKLAATIQKLNTRFQHPMMKQNQILQFYQSRCYMTKSELVIGIIEIHTFSLVHVFM